MAFSPNGNLLASGTTAGTITLYDVPAGEVRSELNKAGGLRSLAISPDGQTLAAGIGPNIKLWDMNTGKMTRVLRAHGKFVGSLDFSRDGKLLASGDSMGIKLWKLAEWAKTSDRTRRST